MIKGKLVKFGDVPGIDPPAGKKTERVPKAKKGAPGPKVQVKTTIKEALGKAFGHRADQLGVPDYTLGMKEGAKAQAKVGTTGFLFGEGDKIRTALSSELTIINAEIGAAEKSKMNINERIDLLSERRRVVEDALLALGRTGSKDKEKKPALKAREDFFAIKKGTSQLK